MRLLLPLLRIFLSSVRKVFVSCTNVSKFDAHRNKTQMPQLDQVVATPVALPLLRNMSFHLFKLFSHDLNILQCLVVK